MNDSVSPLETIVTRRKASDIVQHTETCRRAVLRFVDTAMRACDACPACGGTGFVARTVNVAGTLLPQSSRTHCTCADLRQSAEEVERLMREW